MVRELGIGFVPYSPLGRGFLTSIVKPAVDHPADDMRRHDDRWQPGNYEKNAIAVRELTSPAESRGSAVTQLALAWPLAHSDHIVPIPGTRSPHHLEENVASARVALTAQDARPHPGDPPAR
ncbi:aldo/keto reductase [Streptomyces sp. NPDC059832]|uniref:aldo/keto reductase n=1 Tax=Streptomyces sp. NPDC059832 TaxID=3346966 RepID=UPI00365BBC33